MELKLSLQIAKMSSFITINIVRYFLYLLTDTHFVVKYLSEFS